MEIEPSFTYFEGDAIAARTSRPRLEICAETLQSCLAARDGGADRIELCSGLSEGGLTPSHALTHWAIRETNLPVHVLLRPRAGDFVYSDSEFDVICADLHHAAKLGAAGFVCGVLRHDGAVDLERTSHLVQLASPIGLTFHRAFDLVPDMRQALEDVIACGCRRILTSGGKASAAEGESTIAGLTERARGRIRIMAGGGVTLETAAKLLARTKEIDLHTSLRRPLTPAVPPHAEPTLELQISHVRALSQTIRTASSTNGQP